MANLSQFAKNLRSLMVFLALCVWCPNVATAETTEYKYDALGRLEKVIKGDGTEVDYNLDAAGNRQSKVTVPPGGTPPPPPNNPPNAVNDTVLVPGQYDSVYKNLVANDSDPDGDSLAITSVTKPWNGYVTIVSSTTVDVYGSYPGTATFTYTISDGNGGTDSATVTVTVSNFGGDLR